ncbi:thioesterase [Hazenella sp. IB182353]|nr:thioesterase [Polycladospora coralii]
MSKMKLFCIPHAGGSATVYNRWQKVISTDVELIPVELAGRGSRMNEDFYANFQDAVHDLYTFIETQIDHQSYAILGHSIGSLLAFEITQELQSNRKALPKFIVLSGRRPPDITIEEGFSNLLGMNDEDFLRHLSRTDGIPIGLEKSRIISEFLPIIKADLNLVQYYVFNQRLPRLDVPFLVLYGKEDVLATSDVVCGWEKFTSKSCERYAFSGKHFFLHQHSKDIALLLMEKFKTE